MKVMVGTGVTSLPCRGDQIMVVQNLGPGTLYVGDDPNVTTGNGLQLPPGCVYEYPRTLGEHIYLIADTSGTDVRYMAID